MGLCDQAVLFAAGEDGYHTYRIPALLATGRGTLLAFCEGRRHGAGDAGSIDILVRRSSDGGRHWGAPRVLVSAPPDTCGNPAPVLDRRTDTLFVLFTRNPGEASEADIGRGRGSRTVWVCSSADDGLTFGPPREITASAKPAGWTWYATGPGHGIQLSRGRLLVACDHVRGVVMDRAKDPCHAHVLVSDDGGQTWRAAGSVAAGTNESTAFEDAAGGVCINCRSADGHRCRGVARSDDAGESFGPLVWEEGLPDPICQGSVIRHSLAAAGGGRDRVLFSNPASAGGRERLTVRLSHDEGRTWPVGRVLHPGPAAYSDLAVLPDGTACCLYERGERGPYETLTLARFDLDWLADGAAGV